MVSKKKRLVDVLCQLKDKDLISVVPLNYVKLDRGNRMINIYLSFDVAKVINGDKLTPLIK